MRILTEEERIKIDSSEETLKKWKDFLPTAVENLGYKEETYTNLFPYDEATFYAIDPEKDVPKINKQSGRLIFKRSMADKLEMWLGIGRINNATISNATKAQQLCLLLFMGDIFKTMANRNSKDYVDNVLITVKKEKGIKDIELQNLFVKEYKTMFSQSELVFKDNFFTEEEEKWFDKNIGISDICAMVNEWEGMDTSNNFTEAPTDLLKAMARSSEETASLPCIQTCFENYLVVSMNPSDKLLCSTKQAFTSCMSIMNSDRPTGKQQGPCYGIPALMDNEGVWTLFLTAGCHKNFYFDSDQWMKSGEERDKSQAFKYMKMTARAFAYDGVPITTPAWKTDSVDKLAERLFPRMYIGRLFSQIDSYSRSIGSVFETLVSKELAKFNIKTSINEGHRILEEFAHTYAISDFPNYLKDSSTIGYVTWPMFNSDRLGPDEEASRWLSLFKKTKREKSVSYYGAYPPMKIDYTKFKDASLGIDDKFEALSKAYLNPVTVGYLVNPNIRADDIFDQTNSIYFDNILSISHTVSLPRSFSTYSNLGRQINDYPIIRTNISSCGRGQAGNTSHTQKADFMKLMLGKQKKTELCIDSKICNKCGKIYSANAISKLQIPNPDVVPGSPNDTLLIDICNDCLQELQDKGLVKYCEACAIYYMAELEYKHETVDLVTEIKQKLAETYPQYIPDEQEMSIKSQIINYFTGSQTLKFDLRKICKSAMQTLSDKYKVTFSAQFCVACKQISVDTTPIGFESTRIDWEFLYLKRDTLNTNLGKLTLNISVHKNRKSCIQKVKICSKCHKIIIQSDWNEPLVLMPNGRVICKDCLDKIRLKNKDRELLLDTIKEHLKGSKAYNIEEPMLNNEDKLIKKHFKDFSKQMKSFARNTDLSTMLADCTDNEKKVSNIVRTALRVMQQQLTTEEEPPLPLVDVNDTEQLFEEIRRSNNE